MFGYKAENNMPKYVKTRTHVKRRERDGEKKKRTTVIIITASLKFTLIIYF